MENPTQLTTLIGQGAETNSSRKKEDESTTSCPQSGSFTESPSSKHGTGTLFKPISAAEILRRKPQPIKWIWDSYIAEGDLFVFAAYMKVGKSTFIYPLVISVARGIPFLNRPTKKGGGGVLVLALEENPRDVTLRLRKLGMQNSDPIYVHEGPIPCSQNELDKIKAFIQEKKICLLLIDALAYFWGVKNENDNAEVIEKLKPLLELAREINVAIGLIHHESKYGGRGVSGESQGDGRSIRGGSAFFGIVDQAILLDHRRGGTANQRVLKSIGRRSESPKELVIELVGNPALSDPNSYSYKVLGTPQHMTVAAVKKQVKNALSSTDKDIQTIAAETKLKEKATRTALEELVKEGKATRSGKGAKGDPHKYRLKSLLPAQQGSIPSQGIAIPSIGKETNSGGGGSEDSILPQEGSIEGNESKPQNGKAEQLDGGTGPTGVASQAEVKGLLSEQDNARNK